MMKRFAFMFSFLFIAHTLFSQTPAGYRLVWMDEFNDPSGTIRPDKVDWWYETGAGGWGNNELQGYVKAVTGRDTLALVSDGSLKIRAIRAANGDASYASVRMNTTKSWKYGYFEMRAKLPGGRGVWPAFWMLPENFRHWPMDGEIDIMEYVGYDPDVVNATVHTKKYNHAIGTQRSEKRTIEGAETQFHTYALLWTEDEIRMYVDGENYYVFSNDKKGDKETWPFNVPFYLKLNLAVGGNWGGQQGVDEAAFPATYEIDYVRVYQPE